MKIKSLLTTVILLLLVPTVRAGSELSAFPPADEGMMRYVLQLPSQPDESLFRVELIVGKVVQVDEENRYFFAGKIEAETVTGWGYTRYVVRELGPLAGTLMAIDPDAPRVERFVALGGEPYLIRYNSRLPVVVYVPEGAEVHYRIWSADPGMQAMEEG